MINCDKEHHEVRARLGSQAKEDIERMKKYLKKDMTGIITMIYELWIYVHLSVNIGML